MELFSLKTPVELAEENKSLRARVAELEQVEVSLRETKERYALAMKGANEGLWDWDPVTKELYLSSRLLSTIGMKHNTLKTSSHAWLKLVHIDDHIRYQEVLMKHLKGETEFFKCEYRVRTTQGDYIWVLAHGLALRNDEGIAYRMVGSIGDITQRKQYEQQLVHQANYDYLTGLPNRKLALEELTNALLNAKASDLSVAALFLDLDDFKKINDTLGHDIGDLHLQAVSQRLANCLGDEGFIARLGGDEFLIIIEDAGTRSDIDGICQRIIETTSRPVIMSGYEFYTSVSIGVSVFPTDSDDPGELCRNADSAMYQAKRRGKGQFAYFTPEMGERAIQKLKMESYLRHAIAEGQLSLRYQGLFDFKTGQIVGAEALLRWESPEFGMVSPDTFIPLAEETGLIVELGDWVLETACQQAAIWQQQLDCPFFIAVNTSFPQFRDGHLVRKVEEVLSATGLPAASLELELTERLLLEDEHRCGEALAKLQAMGVRISIDDFGTGYSALTYLKRFPVHTLKIDKSFISDIHLGPENRSLITAIIVMAHALGIKVVGEGIEDKQQQAFLYEQGCDIAQGFYFCKPVTHQEFDKLLTSIL